MDHFTEIQAGDEPEGASSMRIPSRITSFKRPSIKEKQKQKKNLLDFGSTAKHLGWNLSTEHRPECQECSTCDNLLTRRPVWALQTGLQRAPPHCPPLRGSWVTEGLGVIVRLVF